MRSREMFSRIATTAGAAFAALAFTAAAAAGQSAGGAGASVPTPRPIDPSTNTTNPSTRATQSQNPFLGSTPSGKASSAPIVLSLDEAIARGLDRQSTRLN